LAHGHGRFYDRLTGDIQNAEEHMTDIKRMEKPTDLICEMCGKPLVIKWGKHGSFIACTGYPDFPSRSAEADLEKLEKEIAVRRQRTLKDIATHRGKIEARYETELERLEKGIVARRVEHRKGVERLKNIKARNAADLEKLEKRTIERQLNDRNGIEHRLESIQARYPQMNQFYDLDLRDIADGVTLSWQRKEVSARIPASCRSTCRTSTKLT